jgi:hypothetical protein
LFSCWKIQDPVHLIQLLTYKTAEPVLSNIQVEEKVKIFGQVVKMVAPPACKINRQLVVA